ncbi:sensor histidine kinase [Nonomuraea sp. LPB2021202275-12-8]|uniref:sensor histidine kinase n=1 Tax=Nonomuraea sp. LPB2021202275-12-8 TaxID=3120159 RepID=UPI00300C9B00
MRFVRPFQAAWRFFRRPRVFDTVLVAVLVVPALVAAVSSWSQGYTDVARGAVHFALSILPLLVRRTRPLLAAGLVVALDVVGIATGVVGGGNAGSIIAFYSVGRYTPGRTTVIAAAAGGVAYATSLELFGGNPGGWVAGLLATAVPVAFGQLVRVRAELRERARREVADSAVRAERRRIARELHDVVAHHLSVINALVGGARATLPPGQNVTREALAGAEQTARQALAEMRQLLDVLRADGGGTADAATGVGAARLPALVEEAKTAGLPASLTVTGEPVPLPTAVDHAVYRIVQEALTNTRKHTVGARASVLLAYDPAAIEVEVLDDGAAKLPSASGLGLGGMAERVALCGGDLWTGPRLEGGFRVHARIPLERK